MDPVLLRSEAADVVDLQQVLSIDQIRCIRATNDYVDRPLPLESVTQATAGFYGYDDRYGPRRAPHRVPPFSSSSLSSAVGPPSAPRVPLPRSVSGGHQGARVSRSSTLSSSLSRASAASDTRLLASRSSGLASTCSSLAVVSAQPKGDPHKGEPKGKGLAGALGANEDPFGPHLFICERCGRCKCGECASPRRLPSCWACGQRCLCSPETLVEYGSCLCLVKGLFYHCSAQDDGDSCADRPCACTSTRACARWGTMGLLLPLLPCLCCYPPASLCLALCRRAHDRATRPGCRCPGNTNTVCRKLSANQQPAFHKSLDKPV